MILLIVVLNLFAKEKSVSPVLIEDTLYPLIYGAKAFQVLVPTMPSGTSPQLDWNVLTAF